jgi:hypothetical protein
MSNFTDPVSELRFLIGKASDALRLAATYKSMVAVQLVKARAIIQDNRDAYPRADMKSLGQVVDKLGISRRTAYHMAQNAELLGEVAYYATERARVTKREYRAIRRLPEAQLTEVRRLAEQADVLFPGQLRQAIQAVLGASVVQTKVQTKETETGAKETV